MLLLGCGSPAVLGERNRLTVSVMALSTASCVVVSASRTVWWACKESDECQVATSRDTAAAATASLQRLIWPADYDGLACNNPPGYDRVFS
jgi:hypothetical protein